MLILTLIFALGSAEMNTSGQAGGIDYSINASLFETTAITASPSEFSYRSSTLLGQSRLRVNVNTGRLSVDGKDCGAVTVGDKLNIAGNRHVTLNGREVR